MKALGLLLLVAGWLIALSAVVLLKITPERAGFMLAGVGVEVLGLTLVARAHRFRRGENE